MQPEENRIPLKTFKVITNDPEIGEMKIDVESENEESLIKEFRELKMGDLVSFQEQYSNGSFGPIYKKNSMGQFMPEMNQQEVPPTKIPLKNLQKAVSQATNSNAPVRWSIVKLASGQVIQVSSTGEVKEPAWKMFNSPEMLYQETGVKLFKNGKEITEFPKGITVQKEIWVLQEKSETK